MVSWTTAICIPIVAALIGWITNYIAVKMLFRPRRPIRIAGVTLQGLVPKRQRELADSIGAVIEESLLSRSDITGLLEHPELHDEVVRIVEERLMARFADLAAAQPMIGMLLQGPFADQVKGIFQQQLRANVPDIIQGISGYLHQGLDLRKLVRERVESFDLGALESIIYRISARELRNIELLGAVLGFIVGLFQLLLIGIG